jgi:diguanylate cyclase (GGDEF)-like protein
MAHASSRINKKELVEEKEKLERQLEDALRRLALAEEERRELTADNEQLRDRARLLERLRQDFSSLNEKLDLLTRLTKEINALNIDRIFEVCVTKIPFLLNARFASIYLYDDARQRLYLKKHSHNRQIERVIDPEKSPGSLTAHVLADNQVRVFENLDLPGALPSGPGPTEGAPASADAPGIFRPYRSLYATASCIVAPLRAGERVLGVLNLADRLDGRPFSRQEDLPLVQHVAELLAISLRNYQLFEQVQRQAKTDSLTKLANHQAFFDELQKEVERADRYGGELTLMLCDIERFKAINVNNGHLAGDWGLEEVAKVLRDNLRTVDTAARYGGDEFGVLLPESDGKEAAIVAERIRDRVEKAAFRYSGREIAVRLSIGLGQYRSKQGASDLLKSAGDALERARQAGGGAIVVV